MSGNMRTYHDVSCSAHEIAMKLAWSAGAWKILVQCLEASGAFLWFGVQGPDRIRLLAWEAATDIECQMVLVLDLSGPAVY